MKSRLMNGMMTGKVSKDGTNRVCQSIRSHANDLLKAVGQVALTAKAGLNRHLGQRFAGLNQPLRPANTDTFQVSIGRHPNLGPKNPQQVIGTERDMVSQFGQADALVKMVIDIAARLPDGASLLAQFLFQSYCTILQILLSCRILPCSWIYC